MLSLCFYLEYIKGKKISVFVFAIVSGLLSMLAKPMAMTLPVMLLAIDWFHKRKGVKKILVEKALHFAYIVPLAWLAFVYNKDVVSFSHDIYEAVISFVWVISFYITKFFK